MDNLSPLFGVRIFTRPYPTTYVQVRTHRKRRINKKWRKRYGFKTVRGKYDPHEVIRVGSDYHAYPEAIEQIKAQTQKSSVGLGEIPRPATDSAPSNAPVTLETIRKAMEEVRTLIPSQPERISFFAPVPIRVDPTAHYWDSLKFRMRT